ncbi:AbrB/MazE/SpoVT family DNA-binding domain-containing protein [Candidatus Woesearchaeota archaeon]|nr:AbrB/MazE/SpoVT family DNA-binding domain-containing protein [Candidatus Woesearchaeota archaeon]
MSRKLVQLGKSTLLVSIPSVFAKNFGLKKGNEVDVVADESSLIVRAKGMSDKRGVVDVSNLNYSLAWYCITGAYVAGFSGFRINFSSHIFHNRKNVSLPAIEVVSEIVSFLPGVELLEQGRSFCVVKEVSIPKEEDIEGIVSRVWNVLIVLSEGLMEPVVRRRLQVYEEQINHLVLYSLRVIARVGLSSRLQSLCLFAILSRLEEVADSFQVISGQLFNEQFVSGLNRFIVKSRAYFYSCKQEDFVACWKLRHQLKSSFGRTSAFFIVSRLLDNVMDALHMRLVYVKHNSG